MPRIRRKPDPKNVIQEVSKLWWLWLVLGIAWTGAALVILQFDRASVETVGVIIGIMFAVSAGQNLALATMVESGGWVFATFAVIFTAGAVISFISPENTFAAIADILSFFFVLVGVFWIIQAFMVREVSELWWLGLTSGLLMVVLGFWTGGQFFIEKSYLLLVFAGIWALMEGVLNIVRAFEIRKLGQMV